MRSKRHAFVRKRWEERYDELVAFKEAHGHCRVPQKQPGLGEWVRRQRYYRRQGTLSAEDYEALSSIGFVFDGISDKWWRSSNRLERYIKEFGLSQVPDKDSDINERCPELGAWIRQQRHNHRAGRLSRDRFEHLDGMGFVWDLRSDRFERWLAELVEFKNEHGHCDVPSAYPKNQPLANWVRNTRQKYRKQSEVGVAIPITKSQQARLREIGFDLGSKGTAWEARFQMLEGLVQEHGCIPSPLPNTQKHKGLKIWAQSQRELRQRGQLPLDRQQKLDGIHFVWDPEEAAWNDRTGLLKLITQRIGFQNAYLSLVLLHGEPFLKHGGPSHKANVLHGLGITRGAVEDLIDWYAECKAALGRGELPSARVDQFRQLGFWHPVQAEGSPERLFNARRTEAIGKPTECRELRMMAGVAG